MAIRRFEFPDGSLYEVVTSAADTGGARAECLVTLAPQAPAPPPHVHPHQEERWLGIEGAPEFLCGREWRIVNPGETLAIPAGTVHTFRNRSNRNVTFRTVHTPALGLEQYLERLYWLSAMNCIGGRRSLRSLLYTSLLLDAHRQDQVLASPRARTTVRTLAPVARLLGLRIDRIPESRARIRL